VRYGPWLRFGALFAAVAAAAWLFLDGSASAFVDLFADAEPSYLAVAVAVYAASWPLRGSRYSAVLSRAGYACGTAAMTAAVFVSQTTNLIFPARAGDGARAYVVNKRNGVPYTAGAASLVAERVLDLAAVVLIGAVGFCLTASALGFEAAGGRGALAAAGGVGVATVVAVVVVYLLRGRVEALRGGGDTGAEGRLSAAFRTLGDFAADVGAVFDDAGDALRLSGVSLAVWLLDVATCVVLFYALNAEFAGVVAVSLLAVSVGNLAKVVPLTPGGVGLYEAGFAAVVVGATAVGWEAAVAVAVLDHAVKNGVTVVGGVASALALNVSLTRPAEAEVDG